MTHPSVLTCRCGHLEVQHVRAVGGWPHPTQHGPCLVDGCDCKRFLDANDEKDAAA